MQEGHLRTKGDAHSSQNFARSGFSAPHFEQRIARWICVDPDAIRLIDPRGIRALGAKVIGTLDLSGVHVPFGVVLRNCSILKALELLSTEIPSLSLQGSYTGSIHAFAINIS